MHRREGGFKDIHCSAQNVALFVDLLKNIFSYIIKFFSDKTIACLKRGCSVKTFQPFPWRVVTVKLRYNIVHIIIRKAGLAKWENEFDPYNLNFFSGNIKFFLKTNCKSGYFVVVDILNINIML